MLTDSDNAGINFEDISPVSYFTVRDEIWGEVLVCNPDVADGTAKFSVPDEATVLAGDSEENAKSIVKDELNNLYYYEANRSAHPNIKYVKVAYKRNISFNGGGGSGSMADVEYVEGSKYTLPECTFTPPTSKQFKVWEVFGMQYAPGTEIVVDEDTVVTAIWEDKPFEGGGSGGSGSGGSGGGSDSGGSGNGGSGGSRGGVAKGGAQSPAKQPGSWMQDPFGWWYKNADGSYPKGTWQQIDSVWYAFNDAGYMLTGWHSLGGCWYYLNTSGAMSTGWVEVSGKWYYFNTSGAMSTAWIEVNGKWYYLEPAGREGKPQGSLYISENTPDGYPVNELGEWVR